MEEKKKTTQTNRYFIRLDGDRRMVCKNQVSTFTEAELLEEGFHPLNEVVGVRHMTYKMYILRRRIAKSGEEWYTATSSMNKLRNFKEKGWETLFFYANPPTEDANLFLTKDEILALKKRMADKIIARST